MASSSCLVLIGLQTSCARSSSMPHSGWVGWFLYGSLLISMDCLRDWHGLLWNSDGLDEALLPRDRHELMTLLCHYVSLPQLREEKESNRTSNSLSKGTIRHWESPETKLLGTHEINDQNKGRRPQYPANWKHKSINHGYLSMIYRFYSEKKIK